MTFGELWFAFVEQERTLRGLSLAAFVMRAGLGESTGSEWKRGKHVSTRTIDRVLATYGITHETLFERMRAIAARPTSEPVRVEGAALVAPEVAAKLPRKPRQ